MKTFAAILLLALTVNAQTTSDSKGTYMITFPKKIARGWTVPIRVEILDASAPVTIEMKLVNATKPGTIFQTLTDTFAAGQAKVVDFKIPDTLQKPWGWNNPLRMNFTGSGGLTFEASEVVQYNEKSLSVFIQTDKAKYKPGQSVKIRALATGPDLKVKYDPMDIVIYDANKNRIKQWLKASSPDGVISRTLATSYELVLGDWTIEATLGDYKKTLTFTVEEYVLPKYEVAIVPPPYVLTSASEFPLEVTATYTNGRGVDGTAKVRIGNSYYYSRAETPEPLIERSLQIVDGKGILTVKVSDMHELAYLADKGYSWNVNLTRDQVNLRYRSFRIEANVTETITGITLSADSVRQQFVENAFKFRFMDVCPNVFKPGLSYRCLLRATMVDDTLIPAKDLKPVNITVTYEKPLPTTPAPPTTPPSTGGSNASSLSLKRVGPDFIGGWPWYVRTERVHISTEFKAIDPQTGFVNIEFTAPEEADSITIWADGYDRDYPMTKYASKSYSPSNTYIQLSVSDSTAKVGEYKDFTLRSTAPVTKITYQVISRGRIVSSKDVDFPGPFKTFSILITGEMSPNPTVIVFLRRDDGEIVADSTSIKVDGLFDNKVKVEFNEKIVKPGDLVRLKVSAEPNSLVFLASRDLSVLLLKDGNDIDQRTVSQELMSYDYGSYFPWFDTWYSSWWWPRGSSARDAYSVFSGANVAIVTDANVYQHKDASFGDGGPVFMSRGPGGEVAMAEGAPAAPPQNDFEPNERIRTFFPETWLWQTVSVGPTGVHEEDQEAPDTITTWITSGFAVNPTSGLSVTRQTANLTTELKLFLRLELPYSVVRNEKFILQATVFNNYDQGLPVLVTLNQNPAFTSVFLKEDIQNGQLSEYTSSTSHSKYAYVPAGSAKAVYFAIQPTEVGEVMLDVRLRAALYRLSVGANSLLNADGVQRMLLVEPEGKERVESVPMLIDLRSKSLHQGQIQLRFPDNTVPGSEQLTVSVAGDILGPSLENIQNLVRMPYGCGEQNMINFAPNIYVMTYLQQTGRLTPELKDKIEHYMEKGYQRELRYKHRDGGYSTFGENSRSGSKREASTWLTAFVVKSFTQAYPLIPSVIDTKVVSQGLMWLISKQAVNGSFSENGKVFNKRLQGGSGEGFSLTAYVLIALKEAQNSGIDLVGELEVPNHVPEKPEPPILRPVAPGEISEPVNGTDVPVFTGMPPITFTKFTLSEKEVKDAIDKGRVYLENNLNMLTNSYEKLIVAYALTLLKSSKSTEAQAEVEKIAKVEFGSKYWSDPEPQAKPYWYSWYRTAEAKSIEMTAYGLLIYGLTRDLNTGVSVMRWISGQRNDRGGFISTQDTVIALQALSEFASMVYVPTSSMTINAQMTNFAKSYSVNKETSLLLQIDSLPTTGLPDNLIVNAQGSGFAVLEVIKKYNQLADAPSGKFDLTVSASELVQNNFVLTACFRHTQPGSTGMAILNITLTTGYTPDLKRPDHTAEISRWEIKSKVLTLYFDSILDQEQCVFVDMVMTNPVFSSQPGSVTLVDYYEPDEQVTKMYQIHPVDLCSVCTECSFLCRFHSPQPL